MYDVRSLRTHIDARNTIFFSVTAYKPHGTTDYTDGVERLMLAKINSIMSVSQERCTDPWVLRPKEYTQHMWRIRRTYPVATTNEGMS